MVIIGVKPSESIHEPPENEIDFSFVEPIIDDFEHMIILDDKPSTASWIHNKITSFFKRTPSS
ncbi:MAG: hypothetical protein WC222_10855 [Parachlamydiales bacterium]|jgi:hypothetical protein